MNITLNTQVNAPCCPGEVIPDDPEAGEAILIQSDWDFPGFASTFGWSIRSVQRPIPFQVCRHSGTDGTIDCPECGCKAGQFISSAGQWLEENDGATAEDPGYFSA